jgi:group I intron endonuclease
MKNSIISFNQKNPGALENNLTNNIVSVIIYSNTETCKDQILKNSKGKAGVHQWKHNESGKIYIGSAMDLSIRFKNYFIKSYLNRNKTMHIYNALLCHGYSAFSLSILEYIDISNLSTEEVRLLIIKRKQYYLDLIFSEDEPNTYNILKLVGSLLGFKHDGESLAKRSGENHPLFGRIGVNNPFFGKTHSEEAKAIISVVHKGKSLSAEIRTKMSIAKLGEIQILVKVILKRLKF